MKRQLIFLLGSCLTFAPLKSAEDHLLSGNQPNVASILTALPVDASEEQVDLAVDEAIRFIQAAPLGSKQKVYKLVALLKNHESAYRHLKKAYEAPTARQVFDP